MNKAIATSPKPVTGKHVLIGMVSFFGVVMSVNFLFVYFAIDSWTGLTAHDSYRKGLEYNDTLADADRQANLGWQTAVSYDGDRLYIELTGPTGEPLLASDMSVLVRRPTHEGMDISLVMLVSGSGYTAPLKLPEAGQWDIDVSIKRRADHYRMIHRINVSP